MARLRVVPRIRNETRDLKALRRSNPEEWRKTIREAFVAAKGSRYQAAAALGMSRRTLDGWLEQSPSLIVVQPEVSSESALFARRCGGALGLAYAMHDRGERFRDVRSQLREAKAFIAAERISL